jgi:glycerol 2-dehydrogenase (NADP+)
MIKLKERAIVAKGFIVLPKSVTPERIASNAKYAELDADDITKLDGLAADGKQQRLIKPPWSELPASSCSI